MPDRPRSVLIPVANPERAPRYIDLGARIATELQSDLILLSIEINELDDPQAISEETEGGPPDALREMKAYAEGLEVPARILQIKARDVAEGIVAVAQAPDIGYLIMGWRGDEEGGVSAVSHNIDGLIREASAHTIVMQESPLEESERVLLPALSSTLAPLSLAVASILAGEDIPIKVLYLSPSEITEDEEEAFRSSLFTFGDAPKSGPVKLIRDAASFEIAFTVTDDPMKTLVASMEDCDRLVIEASQSQALTEDVHEGYRVSLPEETSCPLVLVRPKNQDVKFGL